MKVPAMRAVALFAGLFLLCCTHGKAGGEVKSESDFFSDLTSRIPDGLSGGFSARESKSGSSFNRQSNKKTITPKKQTAIDSTRALSKRSGPRSAFQAVVKTGKFEQATISADIVRNSDDKVAAKSVIKNAKAVLSNKRDQDRAAGRKPSRTVLVKPDPFKTSSGAINRESFIPDVENVKDALLVFSGTGRTIDANVESKGQMEFDDSSETLFLGYTRLGRSSYTDAKDGAIVRFADETSIAGQVNLRAGAQAEFGKNLYLDASARFDGDGKVVVKPTMPSRRRLSGAPTVPNKNAIYADELGTREDQAVHFRAELEMLGDVPLRAAGSKIVFSNKVSGKKIEADSSVFRLSGRQSNAYKTEYDVDEVCLNDSTLEVDGRTISTFKGNMKFDCEANNDLEKPSIRRRRLARNGKRMRITYTESGREARETADNDKAPIIIDGYLKTKEGQPLATELVLSDKTIDDIKNKGLVFPLIEFKGQGGRDPPVVTGFAQVRRLSTRRRLQANAKDFDCLKTEVIGNKIVVKGSSNLNVEDCITEQGLTLPPTPTDLAFQACVGRANASRCVCTSNKDGPCGISQCRAGFDPADDKQTCVAEATPQERCEAKGDATSCNCGGRRGCVIDDCSGGKQTNDKGGDQAACIDPGQCGAKESKGSRLCCGIPNCKRPSKDQKRSSAFRLAVTGLTDAFSAGVGGKDSKDGDRDQIKWGEYAAKTTDDQNMHIVIANVDRPANPSCRTTATTKQIGSCGTPGLKTRTLCEAQQDGGDRGTGSNPANCVFTSMERVEDKPETGRGSVANILFRLEENEDTEIVERKCQMVYSVQKQVDGKSVQKEIKGDWHSCSVCVFNSGDNCEARRRMLDRLAELHPEKHHRILVSGLVWKKPEPGMIEIW